MNEIKTKARDIMVILILVIGICLSTGCSSKLPEDSSRIEKSSVVKGTQETKNDKLYKVVRIVDGDTIIVRIGSKNERLRMIGMNTPETVKPNTSVQRYGKEASVLTKKLLTGKQVRLEFDVQERDKYSRLLAYVYLQDGRMVNKVLIEEGYAQVMTVPPNVKYQREFLKLQKKAREQGKGLWK